MAGLTAERRTRVKEPVARPAPGAGIRRDPPYVRWIQESLDRLIGAVLAAHASKSPGSGQTGNQPNDDILDRSITQQYLTIRRVFQRERLNRGIAGQRLSADHGSFAGW